MRKDISLYIGGKLVDVGEDNLILFNYTQEEMENPTIVRNSYSQQITLKGTPTNNKVFGSAFRLDRLNDSRFSANKKTSFIIYDERGDILQRGYAKLDNISRRKGEIDYKVTLYGSLGSILYDLSFLSNGTKRTLADLDYLDTREPQDEFTYTINRVFVRNAWTQLSGESVNPLFDVINFAPCLNGKPTDFNANKGVFDGSVIGMSGTLRATLSRDYTEMEAHDLRSYLQRPVLRVKAIFEAIQRDVEMMGWSFVVADNVKSMPYYKDTWLTLPILTKANPATNMRSDVEWTKADLLSGTGTPTDYLLSFVKMFGLKLLVDEGAKRIDIISRTSFFVNETIDISQRIDLAETQDIKPLLIDSKYYDMISEDKGEFAEVYKKTYGKDYGMKRINTGYAFSNDSKTITDKIVFKGGVQSQESSSMYLEVYNSNGDLVPAPFIEGGSWSSVNGTHQEEHDLSLSLGLYTYAWWNQSRKGYDTNDFVQLHGEDNKALDGADVLLFFDDMAPVATSVGISDDIPLTMVDKPCWNWSSINRTPLLEIPHFSRFKHNEHDPSIERSLDWGLSQELNVLDLDIQGDLGIYTDRWRAYLADRYDENTKQVTLKVNLRGMRVGAEMLRKFYWFNNSLWVLNKIKNYSLTTYDNVECEFIKVNNKNNYLNGQY